MEVIINKYFPPLPYKSINLFGIVFSRESLSMVDSNHELIHTAQGKELLWIGFYFLYIFEFLIKLLFYRNIKKAYRNLSFEREAYKHEYELNYLTSRKHFAEWK